jgi:hypothetical protein
MQGAFFGCRTVLVSDAAALCDAHEPHELDESAELEGATVGSLIHRSGSVRVCSGDGCETHVSERLTVKRARHAMLVEATVHALAHRAAPDAVTPMLWYLRAPGDLAASAIVSRTHGVDGFRFLRDAPSTEARVEWTAAIARTVRAFGAARIVHGDLKLNNTCRDDAGAWRVIDFGLSALAREAGAALCEPGTRSLYGDAPPLNASFDLRVLLWSCTLHARTAGPWDHWASRFECEYPSAWRLLLVSRGCCARERPRALTRALHAMYQPVFRRHDAEFEPLRVLDSLRLLRGEAARAEAQRLAAADAPRG